MASLGYADAYLAVSTLDEETGNFPYRQKGRWHASTDLLDKVAEIEAKVSRFEVAVPGLSRSPDYWSNAYESTAQDSGTAFIEAAIHVDFGHEFLDEYIDSVRFEFRAISDSKWNDRRFGNPANAY